MEEERPHVQFDASADDGLYRPQTVTDGRDIQQNEQQNRTDSSRRRSSSDPLGRGRQRPRLAVLRPRGNAAANPALVRIPENITNSRIGSTAFFNAPDGRNEVNAELADVLDVIGAWTTAQSYKKRQALIRPLANMDIILQTPKSRP
jgi:hypothetical protein